MIDHIPSSTTNEDLIKTYRVCGDPVIEELCARLEEQDERIALLEHEIEELERENGQDD
ncbi:MAG: hypothetical protein ROR55_20785 [Devosia sp.]